MKTKASVLIGAAFLGASQCLATPSQADTPGAAEDTVPELTEIIVTATRRPTLLQQTPVAITAFAGSDLDREHFIGLGNIATVSPGLVFTALSPSESYPSIRGTTVGNDAPGSDLGVSVFIDDIPTTGVGDNNPNLFNLGSIEVLRGPQGTLFGRNVTGGAIVIHTLPPDFKAQEKAELTLGNYNMVEGRGYVTGPLVDNTLAGGISFDVRRQDGFLNNVTLRENTSEFHTWGTRGQLLWTSADDLRILGGVDFNKSTAPKQTQLIGNFQPALFPGLSYRPTDVNSAIQPTGDARSSGALLRIDYTVPFGTISSITGYRHADSLDNFSTSAEPANEILQRYRVGADQETEEVHVASRSDQRFDWVGGLFLLNSTREGLHRYGLNALPDTLAGALAVPYAAGQFTAINDQHVHSRSYAVFADATYAFTPVWKLSLGARYTREDKSGHSEVYDTSGLSPDLAATYSHSWTAFNPKATVSFMPSPRILAYTTVASGFKSGGFDTSALTNQGLATPFAPEKVLSYEVGAKITTFDNRLVFDAAAYYAKYKELQVQEFRNLQYITANAGVANIPGLEIETTFNVLPWLTLTGNYSYMNAKYSSYVQGDGSVFTGNQIPFDIKYHYTVGAELHFVSPQLAGGAVRIGGDVTFQGRKFFENENNDYSFITDNTRIRGLANLHANWSSADESWMVSLWSTNINNKRYVVNATDLTAFYATVPEFFAADAAGNNTNKMYVGEWNAPRMFGITVTYKH